MFPFRLILLPPLLLLGSSSLPLLQAQEPDVSPTAAVPAAQPPPPAAGATVQMEVAGVLNARVVAVIKDGAVIPLTDDIDGAGGLATKEASDLLGNKNAHPLPDDPLIPATARHPEAALHYANGDATHPQARRAQGEDTFSFDVPPAKYNGLHLFVTSGWGASKIAVKLIYADGSAERRDLEIPDWYWDLKKDDPHRSYLVDNMGKWNKASKMIEDVHHAIFSLDTTPSSEKPLAKVYVHKSTGGLMVFYGAAGTVAP